MSTANALTANVPLASMLMGSRIPTRTPPLRRPAAG